MQRPDQAHLVSFIPINIARQSCQPPEPAMSSIRGVMLLPISAKSYRSHTAHHTFVNKVNAPETVADPNLALSRLVENRVRGEVAQQLSPTDYRVLRWEQSDIQNRFFVRFRELDGVFEAGNRTTVILEVKASASKGIIKSGLAQLRAAVKTASHAQPKIVGILAIADMGEWFDTFGPSVTRRWPITLSAWTSRCSNGHPDCQRTRPMGSL
jgi:hypothetical protein